MGLMQLELLVGVRRRARQDHLDIPILDELTNVLVELSQPGVVLGAILGTLLEFFGRLE